MHCNSPSNRIRKGVIRGEKWIYKSSRGSSRNFSVQCTSIKFKFNIISPSLTSDPDFVQVIKKCNYSPHLNKVLNVYLPLRVQVSGDWNHEAYFCIQGSTLKTWRGGQFQVRLLETNTRKLLPDRKPIKNMSWGFFDVHILSPTMYRVLWSWDEDPTQVEKRNCWIFVSDRQRLFF